MYWYSCMLQSNTLILSSNKTMLDPNASYTAPFLYPFGFYHGYIHAHGHLILMPLHKKVSNTLSNIYSLV